MLKLKLYQSTAYSCPYIPSNTAHHHTTDPAQSLSKDIYSQLINLGFRRAGSRIHRPNCLNCKQCISLRIPVLGFQATRTQKRSLTKNEDLNVKIINSPDHSKYYDLYNNYIISKHPESDSMHDAIDTFDNFLFSDWSETFAIEYRLPSSELVCVSICDPLKQGWSAVYTFYNISYSQRSLGVFSILKQIELLHRQNLDYLYLGYWIEDCEKMNYKTQFKPCEGFTNNQWIKLNG
ncbi:MAG: arginyltransferase [Pseudomonadota bacterium]